jgi:rare lipoprotein A
VTRPRPSWSELRRRAAALLAGLLLCAAAHAAPGNRPVAKPAGLSADAVGGADILAADEAGLHGMASFYGPGFHGRRTATGEVFDQRGFSAASNRFPLGTWVAVRRLDDDRCVVLKVNDRMHPSHRRRIIDVSRGAAETLGMIRAGVVLVRVVPLRGGLHDPDACREPEEASPAPALLDEAEWWSPRPPPQLENAN